MINPNIVYFIKIKKLIRIKPKIICNVPEKKNEINTEGGLKLKKKKNKIKKII